MRDFFIDISKTGHRKDKDMKASNHNARVDKSGRHNDRNFDVSKASHIDRDLVDQNIYWRYNGRDDLSFEKLETEFYKEHFSAFLEQRNEKYRKRRQYKNIWSANDYRKSQARPEDKILEIGNADEHASPEELWACALEYQKRFNEKYGDHCKILDMALHLDEPEAGPHVHVRRVWIAHDKDGNKIVNQGQALEEMNILPPDTLSPESKQNNAKTTFTSMDRALWVQICKERGIDIDEPEKKRQRSLPLAEYKLKTTEEKTRELEQKNDALIKQNDELEQKNDELKDTVNDDMRRFCEMMEQLLMNPYFNGEYDKKVKKARAMELEQRYNAMAVIFYEEQARIMDNPVFNEMSKGEDARDFVRDRGLEQEFRDYREEKRQAKEKYADTIR